MMILGLFITFLAVCFALVYLGYAVDVPIVAILGFFLMFLLSFTLINENLEFKSGSVITENGAVTTVTSTLSTYQGYSSTIGKYMAIVSFFLFILTLLRESGAIDAWRENYEENNY